MTREEQINEAVKTSITETLLSTPNYEFSPRATDMLECAFTKGAEWADSHPKNPWHKASVVLPKECTHILMAHKMRNGDYAIEAVWYPEPSITDKMEYWMEIPEIPEIKED